MDRKGFTLSEVLMVFMAVLLAVGIMTPVIRIGKNRLNTMLCENNLRQQGLAMYIYAREHDGNFPDSFKALYKEKYLADPAVMDCPASKHTGTPDDPDYLYTGGLSVREASGKVLVRDKEKNHVGGQRNILDVSGRIGKEISR